MENFDDIRPYQDDEVDEVIGRLLKNDEFFNAISGFKLPKLKNTFPKIANGLVKKSLKKKLSEVKTIAGVQEIISTYMGRIIETTTTGINAPGLIELSKGNTHLYMSNHRDIVMDPAFVSYLLHQFDHGTVQIAIGDNLLKKEFISDLMRLNKSFIVKRSAQGREKLIASKHLSKYIHHSIDSGESVWIAQREGRAKNGLDKTDAALLKMLHLGVRDAAKKIDLKDAINKLHIIPVSISYEYDPCVELKARELFEIDKNGHFEKDERSDIVSISKGMEGQKGSVHVSFGKEISAIEDDAVAIASQLDRQIILNYKLHPSNYLAYEKIQIETPSTGPKLSTLTTDITDEKRNEFEEMYQQIETELRPYFLQIYANPVINKFQFEN